MGLQVCPPPPPPNPACGPTCPTGGSAVWTGTITGFDGKPAEFVISLCPDPNGYLVGGWSCRSGSGNCIAPGASIRAGVVGSNFIGYSRQMGGFIDPVWGCDFEGLLSGATLSGHYSCSGYAGFSGTWQATACG